ncbi:MAG: hypothetical protein LWX70_09955 [Sphingobacteriia bacterium]|nr:hypothetical protein [Sphingobacteriia bacterium]
MNHRKNALILLIPSFLLSVICFIADLGDSAHSTIGYKILDIFMMTLIIYGILAIFYLVFNFVIRLIK